MHCKFFYVSLASMGCTASIISNQYPMDDFTLQFAMHHFVPMIRQKRVKGEVIPDLSLRNPQNILPHDLPRQLYQTLAGAPSDPCFVSKMYAIKLVDMYSHKNSLQKISIDAIKALSESDALSACGERLIYDIIYDPKYYVNPDEYWMTIERFHNDSLFDASAFRMALNQNFNPFKLQLMADPALVQRVVFPIMRRYKSRNGNYCGFPDFGVVGQRPTADRAALCFQFISKCAVDRGFVGHLVGLKVIDEFQPESARNLKSISFDDIQSLRVSAGYQWEDFVVDVAECIHFPEHYASPQMFISTLNRVHGEMADDEFKITAEHWMSHWVQKHVSSMMSRFGDFGVGTLIAMNDEVLRRYQNFEGPTRRPRGGRRSRHRLNNGATVPGYSAILPDRAKWMEKAGTVMGVVLTNPNTGVTVLSQLNWTENMNITEPVIMTHSGEYPIVDQVPKLPLTPRIHRGILKKAVGNSPKNSKRVAWTSNVFVDGLHDPQDTLRAKTK